MTHLSLVPDLGIHDIPAGALTAGHCQQRVAIQTPDSLLIGTLSSVWPSILAPHRPVLRLTVAGRQDVTVQLRPAHPVTVLPAHSRFTVRLDVESA